MKYLRVVLGAAGLFTVGCGDIPLGDEPVGAAGQPITGGALFGSQAAPDTSVVKIEWSDAFFTRSCTAMKVESRVFWTAAHCLDTVTPGTTVFKVTNRLDGTFAGSESYTRTVSATDVHPSHRNYLNAVAQPARLGRSWHYDVARFTLSATTPNIPAYSAANSDTTWWGTNQQVTYTGYGCDDLRPEQSGQKQWAYFTLSDFNTVKGHLFDTAYDIYAHSMVTIGDLPQGCKGDSGAPVFKLIGGIWKTVGIASHGVSGWTGMQRYSNVWPWLRAPAFNNFIAGFQGSLMNQISGRCMSYDSQHKVLEATCDTRAPTSSNRTWNLASGGPANVFNIVNAQNNLCLDLETTAQSSALVLRACVPTTQANNTQLWRFDATQHADYRRLVNNHTGRCTVPSDRNGDGSVLQSSTCSSSESSWRNQAWMMTR